MSAVVGLFRYPVKSLGGERLQHLVAEPGAPLPEDRSWAVLDPAAGRVLTAKLCPDLLYAWVERDDRGCLLVSLPELTEGMPVAESAPALSAWLGREVAVVAWPALGLSFDFGADIALSARCFGDCGAVLHLITTGELRRLQPDLGDQAEVVRRLRPNLVIDTESRLRPGDRLLCGEVVVEIAGPTERCVLIGQAQPGRPARPEALGWLQQRRHGRVGHYARIVRGGRLETSGRLDD